MAYTIFPSLPVQALIAVVHLVGMTIISIFLALRVSECGPFSWSSFSPSVVRRTLGEVFSPRTYTLLVFLTSYLFLFVSSFLIFGLGLQLDAASCGSAIYLCVTFYTTSKVLIYIFLCACPLSSSDTLSSQTARTAERVHIVWDTGTERVRSPVYLVCAVTVAMYVGVVVAVFVGRIDEFREGDGACVIGLKTVASIPLLSYDLYVNILLTGLFLYPIFRSSRRNPRLRRVAIHTVVAAGIALSTSTVNMVVLTVMHGRQLGWLCLTNCATDVIINSAALFWVTSRPSASDMDSDPQLADVEVDVSINVNEPDPERTTTAKSRTGAQPQRSTHLLTSIVRSFRGTSLKSDSSSRRSSSSFTMPSMTEVEVRSTPPTPVGSVSISTHAGRVDTRFDAFVRRVAPFTTEPSSARDGESVAATPASRYLTGRDHLGYLYIT
ncbi:unnamed protein product [Mycena citricolor]|uniref:Uncharacterized protein n=1 Tax=Mycena citricolor TaxID=2018698 RepID=A0AAD2HJ85_9AGAR|nr:unnamed protein product [Mycena citricolor]